MHTQHDDRDILPGAVTKTPPKSNASSLTMLKASAGPNELVFTRIGPWRINMEISTKNQPENTLYSIDIAGLFSDNTEITMYSGSKKENRVLGHCRFNKFRPSEMQISSHGTSSRMIWIKQHDSYRWSVPQKSEAGEKTETMDEKYFLWKTVEYPASSSGNRVYQNLELGDMDNSTVYAAYSGGAPGTKSGGSLLLREDMGEDMITMAVLTVCGLIEKERQTRARKGNFTIGMLAY
ncbi:uncharacterized protein N7496_008994 [Penicillium cataractarum]|uniref:Uncharacterized protein n=1 Tax=Penicillium cataractarum TaxID=2100454 RepID=A0A9W9V692_9EURO|nr:uncharacterized protein N7496_008994 [Penicillium cataractarum]KAJ5369234.1 hypothetical protein N7496_008994 [Penicillium cataractarum]